MRIGRFSFGLSPPGETDEQLRLAREEIGEKDRRIEYLQRRLGERNREVRGVLPSSGEGVANALAPENVVWIFCTGRSGSTWLARMMADLPGNALWDEPLVGALFGEFYERKVGAKRGAKFIMGARHRGTWLRSIRHMVLDGARARYEVPEGARLIVKEPHGSVGAPLLSAALPESELVLLVRDPRDVMASELDAHSEGSWRTSIARISNKPGQIGNPNAPIDADPDVFLEEKARENLRNMQNAKEAFEAHGGPKALVRYEDLRADALGTMRRLCSDLGWEVEERDLVRVVEEHAWERVPEEKKGQGKFFRRAEPGGWREDLTPEQARIVEDVMAPLLDEFYPDRH